MDTVVNVSDVKRISHFLSENHVLTVCAVADGDMWSANCFYVVNTESMELYIMTELKTLHGALMQKNPHVVGTIAPHPKTVALIKGIQYRACATILEGDKERTARSLYCQKFPVAIAMKSPIWQLKLDEIKMTDNTLGFAKKLLWKA